MKYIIVLFLFFSLSSCDDGDFDVPEFDFSDSSIEDCGDLILFQLKENESLNIELNFDNTDNVFFEEEREDSFTLNETITYRIYNGNISSSYFCQDIPPSSPVIEQEWVGSGTLLVTNTITANATDSTYLTTLIIENMVLVNSSGNEIRFETFDYGSKSGSF